MIGNIQEDIDVLNSLDSDIDKYEFIVELGKDLKGIAGEELLNDENYVAGCQSDVWLHHVKEDDILQFYAHSDSKMVKGLLYILTEAFSGYTPNEMLNFNISAIQKIPLGAQLSMQRQIGMMSVFKKMQYLAKKYTASA